MKCGASPLQTPANTRLSLSGWRWSTPSLFLLLFALPAHPGANGYAQLVRRVAPSVVTVLVKEKREGAAQQAVDRAAENTEYAGVSNLIRRLLSGPGSDPAHRGGDAALGSGFIIRADGLIVTNRHVILGAQKVEVKLEDGRQLPATIVGADSATDIALLKIKTAPMQPLQLGSSQKVSVGDVVIAIGNPFGLGQTVTAGILSARGRTLEDDPYIDFLQTDAAINFGNSGGPLLSEDGTVVGVTSAIFSPSGGSVGLGFAIPAETVSAVVDEIEKHGRVARGFLGISAQRVTPAVARALGLKTTNGALVTVVDPKGPSAGALKVGDAILQIGPAQVTYERFGRITSRLRPGVIAQAKILRDGEPQQIALLVGQLPDPPEDPALTGGDDTWVPALAIGVAKSTSEIRAAIKSSDESAGLIVTQLRPTGGGALAGLRIGDLITHAGTKQLQGVTDLAAVSPPSTRTPLLLRIVRNGTPAFVAVTGVDDR
jgi:serine protease Do